MYVLHYAPDNASLILRLIMEELGVAYRTILVDRAHSAHKSAAYLRINPNGLIPALETPHGVLFETGAAALWLADTHGALMPAPSDATRGDALKWLFFVANTIHPCLRLLFYPDQYVGTDKNAAEALTQKTAQALIRHFAVIDKRRTHPRDPQIIDIYLACCLRWCALYGPADRGWFQLDATPALADLCARFETRASVAAAVTAEGLGTTPFTRPSHPNPPEGSAT